MDGCIDVSIERINADVAANAVAGNAVAGNTAAANAANLVVDVAVAVDEAFVGSFRSFYNLLCSFWTTTTATAAAAAATI